jgi:uncharacterized membrane protein
MNTRHIAAAVSTFVAFLALDVAWLMLAGAGFFQAEVGALLRATPDLFAAALFYVIYATALVVLAVEPALCDGPAKNAMTEALWKGALFGLAAYATFDLTNLAVLKGWTWTITLIDMAWGTLASSLSSIAGFAAGRWANRSHEA